MYSWIPFSMVCEFGVITEFENKCIGMFLSIMIWNPNLDAAQHFLVNDGCIGFKGIRFIGSKLSVVNTRGNIQNILGHCSVCNTTEIIHAE